MKPSNKIFLTVLLVCIIILSSYYLSSRNKSIENNKLDINSASSDPKSAQNSTTNDTNIIKPIIENDSINIFYANFSETINDSKTTDEPGVRSEVVVGQSSLYHQTGNAKGRVIVNDPTGKFVYTHDAYIFNTKYDALHNWFTLTKTPTKARSVGDQ